MLVLTRRIGESIRIGDNMRLTIRSKLRAHFMVSLIAPADVLITDDTHVALKPMSRRRCSQRYLIGLVAGDSLRIGEEIVIWFGENSLGGWLGFAPGRQVRLGIHAPRAIPVHREEIYQRIRRGQPDPRRERH